MYGVRNEDDKIIIDNKLFLLVKFILVFDLSELNKKCNNNVWKWFLRELILLLCCIYMVIVSV